jgi:L-amino acid N-acyltransferase YncA
MEDISIRTLSGDDLRDLESHFSEPRPGSHATRLKKQARGKYSYYGLFADGKLIGISLIRWSGAVSNAARSLSNFPELGSTFILPEYRGRGLFSTSLNKIEGDVLAKGYNSLGAAIRDTNTHSIAIHEARGYQPVGSIEPHPNDPLTTRHYYIKRLQP